MGYYNDFNTMNDLSVSLLRAFRSSADLNTSSASPTATGPGVDFQSLFTQLLFSNDPMGDAQGNSPWNDLISPVLINLIEQIAAMQISPAKYEGAIPVNPDAFSKYPAHHSAAPWGAPLAGPLTQGYSASHKALDFGVPVGTQARATMDGKVVFAGWSDQGYGNLVIVENGSTQTYYAHLSQINVHLGQNLPAETIVGLTGNTGNSTGPHLHYEVRRNGQAVDPTAFTLLPST